MPLLPEQASTLAFLALLVLLFVIVFAVKDRDRTGERVGESFHASVPLKIGWSIVPFLVTMMIFAWATAAFFDMV
jgi:heme/copper-type cytochrome/quinol oxidase subunit 2